MFKSFEKNDAYIRKLTVYAEQALVQNSPGVKVFTGISGSNHFISSSNWNWTNVLFYNQEYGESFAYKASYGQVRNLDTTCRVISFPIVKTGKKIKPGTFKLIESLSGTQYTYLDDGRGNIYEEASGSSYIKGNLFYHHGVLVMTDTGSIAQSVGTSTSINFRSTHEIFEHNYLCKLKAGEGNYTTNPTAIYGSDASSAHAENELRYPSGSVYITTVGLYDDYNQLLATARLAKPVFNDNTQDITFHIRIDI